MRSLLDWLDGGLRYSPADQIIHVEDDYYPKSKYVARELKNISYLYYFN